MQEKCLTGERTAEADENGEMVGNVRKAAISKHLKNIFAEGELQENSVVSKMETTAADGKNYNTNIYNLDAIIAVGYRINSKKNTMFRIWATQVLKEYIIKGFAMNDERLKNPVNFFGKDYFEEQLERIREIRASERRFYQKITDIYARCSADYSPDSQITKDFFATVQNKLHAPDGDIFPPVQRRGCFARQGQGYSWNRQGICRGRI